MHVSGMWVFVPKLPPGGNTGVLNLILDSSIKIHVIEPLVSDSVLLLHFLKNIDSTRSRHAIFKQNYYIFYDHNK